MIGVLLYGDGYTRIWIQKRKELNGRVSLHGSYDVSLTAKSLRFVTVYRDTSGIALGRKPTKIWGPNKNGHFTAEYSCADFLRWWYKMNLSSLAPIVRRFKIDYLRGRFDSDGYVQEKGMGLCGADGHREVLVHDNDL
jgi:hypothetical protein